MTSTVLNLLARGIGFVNNLLIAFYFGANAGTDIYFYILAVAVLITSSINGIDSLVLVPESMKIRTEKTEKESQRFLNFFIYVYLLLGLILVFMSTISPAFFYTLFSEYDIDLLNNNHKLLFLGGLIFLFQLMNNLLTVILTSYKYFTAPIISGLINSVFAIVFTLIFHESLGITGTILGIVLGYFVNFLALIYTLKKRQKWDFFNVGFLKDKTVWRNIGYMQLNILPVWLRNYFTIYFLTGMGTGVITSFNLAQMLALLPEVFFLTQVASVVGIKFSELAAKKEIGQTNTLLIHISRTLLIVIIPIAVVMAVANKEVIQIAFDRGNFDKNSSTIAALCFFYFALLLPAKVFDVLFSRLFTSFQLYGISTVYAIIAHSIITLLIYILTVRFHLQGYFIAMLIGSYLVLPFTFLLIIKKKLREISINILLKDAFVMIVTGVIIYYCVSYFYDGLEINHFFKIIALSLVVAIPFLLLANWMVNLKYQKELFVSLLVKKQKKVND